jgi:hypothetical protein
MAPPGQSNLTGNVKNPEVLFKPEVAAELELRHPGVFAFLSFHPELDTGFKDYLSRDAIGAVGGREILVLFTVEKPIHRLRELSPALLAAGVSIRSDEHPAYEVARIIFRPKQPPLPGIIFFRRLSGLCEPVFVHVAATSADSVGNVLRTVFALANESYSGSLSSGVEFTDILCDRLALNGIQYVRLRSLSAIEVLARGFYAVKRNLKDIAAVVDLIK